MTNKILFILATFTIEKSTRTWTVQTQTCVQFLFPHDIINGTGQRATYTSILQVEAMHYRNLYFYRINWWRICLPTQVNAFVLRVGFLFKQIKSSRARSQIAIKEHQEHIDLKFHF